MIAREKARAEAERLLAIKDDDELVAAFDQLDPAIAVFIIRHADGPERKSDGIVFGALCAKVAIASP
jgi:hypothetical protein